MKRLLWLAPLSVLLAGFPGCPGSYELPLPAEAKVHRAKTADGWELSLVQYPARGPSRGRPVLVCHGISANARGVDLDDEHSLPRWLAKQGREAWTVSLRATGDSDQVDEAKGRKADFTFDTYVQQDLRAAVDYVRHATGADSIDFIGHSMGGMLLYAYLAEGGPGIHAAVTLASPTRLDWGTIFLPLMSAGSGVFDDIPVVTPARLTLPFHGQFRGEPVETLLYTPENTSETTWKRLIANGIANIHGPVARQLLGMVRSGRFASADGKIDYRADMAKIRVPVLVVAGKADRLAVSPAVKDGYRALGGPKEWLLLGEEDGVKADYGHMDLVMGERAPTEVWPRVLDFLDRHEKDGVVAR